MVEQFRRVAAVVAGDIGYDDATDTEQRLVRALWRDQIADRLASLDLAAERQTAGETWTEADPDGNTVLRGT